MPQIPNICKEAQSLKRRQNNYSVDEINLLRLLDN